MRATVTGTVTGTASGTATASVSATATATGWCSRGLGRPHGYARGRRHGHAHRRRHRRRHGHAHRRPPHVSTRGAGIDPLSLRRSTWGIRRGNPVGNGCARLVIKRDTACPAFYPPRERSRLRRDRGGLAKFIPNPQALRRRRILNLILSSQITAERLASPAHGQKALLHDLDPSRSSRSKKRSCGEPVHKRGDNGCARIGRELITGCPGACPPLRIR